MAEPKLIPFPLTEQESQRLISRIQFSDPDICWPWIARLDQDGYGIICIRRINYRVSRVVYRLFYNQDPSEHLVRHSCDNPTCCNPFHLLTGTAADNSHDCVNRGRTLKGDNHPRKQRPEQWPRGDEHWTRQKPERLARGDANGAHQHPEKWHRGETHHKAKFTEEDIRTIRRLHAEGSHSYSKLGQMYGVDWRYINRIVKRKHWKHVA